MGFYMLILFSATSRNSLVLTDFVCPYVCVCVCVYVCVESLQDL